MSPQTSLGQRIAAGMVIAFGEHMIESSPELRLLAQACGYVAPVPPAKRIASGVEEAARFAEGILGDAAEAAKASFARRLREKSKKKAPPKKEPAPYPTNKDDLREKLSEVFEKLSPVEREMVETMLREKEAPEEVIDLIRKADGSYGAKEEK